MRAPRVVSRLLPLLLLVAGLANASSHATYTLRRIAPKDISLLTNFMVTLDASSPGTSALITVGGTVTLGGTLTLNTTGGPFPAGKTYLIIDNDGNDPIIGTFAGLPQGAILTSGGQAFSISYSGGTGNDLVLTALPPVPALSPRSLFVLAIGLAIVALMAMRR
jgi:hypothetical protein